jgi:glycosyltransferase involved in cell wall biosynthesis
VSEVAIAASPDEQGLDATEIAVVIPLYGQAQFVTEAVSSVLAQTHPAVTAVIVNDGCPDPDSHRVGQSLAMAHPGRVTYFRRPNGGLSAARNTGIRFAKARFPKLEGIFLLDSDNVIEPDAIAHLRGRLDADPTIDWVSPHLRLFGEINRPWRLVEEFSRFRQLFENQADAAALFRPQVFDDAGYDESMRQGYEDWAFYLDRLLAGCRGVTEPLAVMWYRSRRNSMLASAVQKHQSILDYMRSKHAEDYLPRGRTVLEHDELPRFAIVDEVGRTRAVSDPARAPTLGAASSLPPIVVVADSAGLRDLERLGLLRGVLFTASPGDRNDVVVLSGGPRRPFGIDHRLQRDPSAVFGVVMSAHAARVAVDQPDAFVRMLANARAVVVRHPELHPINAWSDLELVARAAEAARTLQVDNPRARSHPEEGAESNRDFVAWMHQELTRSTFPLAADGHTHVGFVLPWLKLGGVEHCVIQVTRAMRAKRPDLRFHVALTEGGDLATSPADTWAHFDSLTVVAGLPWERRVALAERWSASMDVVVNAHSGIGFDALGRRADNRPWDHHSREVAYLHVVDDEPHALRNGWPMQAARLDAYIDRFLVISESMAATLRVEGVPERKILRGPNAPVVRPTDIAAARHLATQKAARLADGATLRILIAGRLDHQKGGARASVAISQLVADGRDVHVYVLGEPTLAAEIPDLPPGSCTWLGATSDPEQLSAHFAATDLLLLLSRWEGVPLAMLDAMAHGSVVVATAVGAIPEVARDRDNARLIWSWPGMGDRAIGVEAATIVEELLDDPSGSVAMRQRAVETAWSMSWDTTADAILSIVDSSSRITA